MRASSQNIKPIPLEVVGSTTFGRYPKISSSNTYNMIISDEWLVPFAGYKLVVNILNNGVGRAIFSSTRFGRMIAVIENQVYVFNNNLSYSIAGELNSYEGDVFIDENNNSQIAICDKQNIYIYNWLTSVFTLVNTDFQPGYITYQDSYFIAADVTPSTISAPNPAQWRLSKSGDGTVWPADSQHKGALQTKPDYVTGVLRVPGRGNNLYVFGSTVTELWADVGAQLFPYQRNTSVNIDYGCLSPSTLASSDNIAAWLGANERSGPVIMYSTGGDIQKISTDGIDFRLSQLANPTSSYAFFFKQDGHLFYQITFSDPRDNLTLAYDFNTQKFFTLTDEQMNFHIAKRVAFFNNQYYFVSFIDGNLYQLSSEFNTYDYGNGDFYEIPRVRVCNNIGLPDASRYVINYVTFTLEQGTTNNFYQNLGPFEIITEDGKSIVTEGTSIYLTSQNNIPYVTQDGFTMLIANQTSDEINNLVTEQDENLATVPRIDMCISKDGGESYGSNSGKELNALAHRKNKLIWYNLGYGNYINFQFRFWGLRRFVVMNGEVGIYQ